MSRSETTNVSDRVCDDLMMDGTGILREFLVRQLIFVGVFEDLVEHL